jgi:predicted nucleotidyltransferase
VVLDTTLNPVYARFSEDSMISEETIQLAVQLLAHAAPATRIILFGSYARGTPSDYSDLDFLVLKRVVRNRRAEIVRLLRVLEPHGIPADVLVASEEVFDAWKDIPGTVLYEASQEGRVVYEAA